MECRAHPDAAVVKNGVRLRGRRQRYICRPPGGRPHQLTAPLTEELVGSCLTCRREWERGLPVARQARFLLDHVVTFLCLVGQGFSQAEAAERARLERADLDGFRAAVTGRARGNDGEVSTDGRMAADWLERYGALVARRLMPTAWPMGTVMVDAKTFQIGARYPGDHPERPGHPFPSGQTSFAVLAAAARGPKGKLRIVHIRAAPHDHKPSWADFFRSLPGKPETVLSDPDPQIDYAIKEVWPDDPPLHPLSTWHYWAKLQEKFTSARLYPWTDALCRDAEAAFGDAARFRVWRQRAESEGPVAVRSWLRKKGDEVQARLDGADPPLAIGDLETFLRQKVGYSLESGRGRIRNLPRLDIRLSLIALDHNRSLRPARLADILSDQLGEELRLVARRSLDGAPYDPTWLLSGVQLLAIRP